MAIIHSQFYVYCRWFSIHFHVPFWVQTWVQAALLILRCLLCGYLQLWIYLTRIKHAWLLLNTNTNDCFSLAGPRKLKKTCLTLCLNLAPLRIPRNIFLRMCVQKHIHEQTNTHCRSICIYIYKCHKQVNMVSYREYKNWKQDKIIWDRSVYF